MEKGAKIYVAGHNGMVGSALVRHLQQEGYENLVLRSHEELDLVIQAAVESFFQQEKPEYVFLAAARVGGILANDTYPAEFIHTNLAIETNVIHAAWKHGVKKLLFLGSSCIYPRNAPQPIPESCLLDGKLETTNQWYAIAKIAGIHSCQAYHKQYGMNAISVMPTNLYGPGDNFDLHSSHVLSALIRKFVEARDAGNDTVTIWGTGTPRREFMHVDDLAGACIFLMQRYDDPEIINIGSGKDITIAELATLIAELTGYTGRLEYDTSRPDGTPRKLLDNSRIQDLGWSPAIPLREGISSTIQWYRSHICN